MIVLVDGPDGSGKTTLCDLLQDQSFDYIHLEKRKDVDQLYTKLIDHLKSRRGEDIVIDRAYISNLVYSNVFKDTRFISLKNLLEIHNLVDVIVLAIPREKDQYLQHFESLKGSRDELYSSMEKVYDLYRSKDSYNFLLQDKQVIEYDMFNDDLSTIIQQILQRSQENVN